MLRRRGLIFVGTTAWFAAAAWIAIAGCVGDSPASPSVEVPDTAVANPTETSTTADATADTATVGPACDLSKPFDAPVPIAELNTDVAESSPWPSVDKLTIYFSRRDGDAGPTHLYTARRSTPDGTFADVKRIDELVTAQSEAFPTVTGDGLFMYYASNFPDGGTDGWWDLFGASRTSVDASFGGVQRLAFSSVYGDSYPFVLPDNTALYSTVRGEVDAAPFDGRYRLYRTNLPGGPRVYLTTPNIPDAEMIAPVVTPDELTMLFASTHPAVGAQGLWDIFLSRREKTTDPWGAPVIQVALNSDKNEFPRWISPDGCEVWMDSGRSGANDLFIARRPR